jgi:Ca2+-binding RTX toxin-like protein
MPPYFRNTRRAAGAVLAVVAVAAAGQVVTAGAAHAVPPSQVTVEGAGTIIRFIAEPATTNNVTVAVDPADPTAYRLTDPTHTVSALFPCTGVTANSVSCPGAGITYLQVYLGDLNDSARNATKLPATLSGEAGNDQLFGGVADESLSGGADNDLLEGGTGDDSLSGSTGTDWVYYSTRATTVMVTANSVAGDGEVAIGENDNVSSTVENIFGGSGNDHLVGNTAANVINGYNGSDHIYGGSGADTLSGGAGARDIIYGEAGADSIDGGNDAGDSGDGDWNQDGVDDDVAIDTCSAATEVQYSC